MHLLFIFTGHAGVHGLSILTLRLEQALAEVAALHLVLKALDLMLDVDLAVRQSIEVLQFISNLF